MDLMYIIILWLKRFIERMALIASFIGDGFLPEEDYDDDDLGVTGTHHQGRPGGN